jgi:hypothetical protein
MDGLIWLVPVPFGSIAGTKVLDAERPIAEYKMALQRVLVLKPMTSKVQNVGRWELVHHGLDQCLNADPARIVIRSHWFHTK